MRPRMKNLFMASGFAAGLFALLAAFPVRFGSLFAVLFLTVLFIDVGLFAVVFFIACCSAARFTHLFVAFHAARKVPRLFGQLVLLLGQLFGVGFAFGAALQGLLLANDAV